MADRSVSETLEPEPELPVEEAPKKPRGRSLLISAILLGILAAFGYVQTVYMVVNAEEIAAALASQDEEQVGTLDEIQQYFDPGDTSILEDYRAFGVASAVVSLSQAVIQTVACVFGIRTSRSLKEGSACQIFGIALMGVACVFMTLDFLALGIRFDVFLEGLVSGFVALAYFLAAKRIDSTDFWEGIRDQADTAIEAAKWVGEIEARAATLPREFRLNEDYMLEPVREPVEGEAIDIDRGSDLKALFSPTTIDHATFATMTIVPEKEFGLIAPIAAYLADDGTDPDDVPVGHCRAYALKSCVAGTLGFPPNALEPRLPGIPRDVEAHFYMDAERLVFGTDDPEFVVLVNDYVKDQTFEKDTAGGALFEVLEFIVDDGLTYLSLEEDRLEHLEDNMAEDVTEIPRDFDLYISHERRSLGELYNFYRQYADLATTLANTRSVIIDPEDRSLFSVLSDSAHHMAQDTQNLRDFALQIRGLFQSKIDERQNKVMSLLTVVTTIFMPLTLITGWFGMNFDVMPELHWEGSYYVVIALSFAVVTGEIIFFKHKRWF